MFESKPVFKNFLAELGLTNYFQNLSKDVELRDLNNKILAAAEVFVINPDREQICLSETEINSYYSLVEGGAVKEFLDKDRDFENQERFHQMVKISIGAVRKVSDIHNLGGTNCETADAMLQMVYQLSPYITISDYLKELRTQSAFELIEASQKSLRGVENSLLSFIIAKSSYDLANMIFDRALEDTQKTKLLGHSSSPYLSLMWVAENIGRQSSELLGKEISMELIRKKCWCAQAFIDFEMKDEAAECIRHIEMNCSNTVSGLELLVLLEKCMETIFLPLTNGFSDKESDSYRVRLELFKRNQYVFSESLMLLKLRDMILKSNNLATE